LDRRHLTTPAADYNSLCCHLLDIQPVETSFVLTSVRLNAIAQELAMGSIRVLDTSFLGIVVLF
jgi:hypothetical protein